MTSEYGVHGERQSSRVTDQDDITGLPRASSTLYVNEHFADGVALLAQKYFDFNASL
jgi:hypothetical protein